MEDEVNAAGALALGSENAEIAVQYQTAVIKNSYAVQSQSDSRRPLTHVAPRRPFASSHLPPHHHRQHSRAVDCIPRARLATPLPATPTRWHVSHLYRRAEAYNLREGKSNNKPLARSQIKAVA